MKEYRCKCGKLLFKGKFKGIVSIIVYYIQEYWPLFITFCGVSLLATPQKTKKKWNKKYWFYIAKWIETR